MSSSSSPTSTPSGRSVEGSGPEHRGQRRQRRAGRNRAVSDRRIRDPSSAGSEFSADPDAGFRFLCGPPVSPNTSEQMYDLRSMDTVTLTIDGRPVTVEKGKTVLQAAIESGIQVPYYCYHPGLGIDGSCRVCIVKIEKMPKLQTSCSTTVAEGMVGLDSDARRRRGARQRVRVPAHQSPARLPGVRQGRRVPAPGFLLQLRAEREPDGVPAARVRRRRGPGRRGFRSDADAQPQPLHPLHAVRAVHARGGHATPRSASWTAATAARSPRSRKKACTRCSRGI